MEDCIRRKDAVRELAEYLMEEAQEEYAYASDDIADWIECAEDILEDVPSVSIKRPTGKWKYFEGDNTFECSECGASFGTQANYCPNCGAEMEECWP